MPLYNPTTGAGTLPSFSVHKNGTDQTGVVTATFTKVSWGTEEFDTNSNFASDRFTPTVAGKYKLTATVYFNDISTNVLALASIYKNGARYRDNRTYGTAGGTPGVIVSAVIDFNGSTDYAEVFAYHSKGSNAVIEGDSDATHFSGCKVG